MTSRSEGKSDLLATVAPILNHLASQDVAPTADSLSRLFPLDGPLLTLLRQKLMDGSAAGWLTPREAGGVKFGRIAKSTDASSGFTIDAVDMNGPGPGHTHPEGEVDLCFALTEDALFDGNPQGWVVYGPGSWHVPTVSRGRMIILYFLPNGSIRFEPRPA